MIHFPYSKQNGIKKVYEDFSGLIHQAARCRRERERERFFVRYTPFRIYVVETVAGVTRCYTLIYVDRIKC